MFPFIDKFELWILQPFGILLATGLLLGSWWVRKWLDRYKMDEDTNQWLVIRLLVSGFLLAHLVNTVFYEPHVLVDDPVVLLKVWAGISSYGGIMGAIAMFIFFTRGSPELNHRRWADMLVSGLVLGFWFGRMGCASVHDHLGAPADPSFWFAITAPAGNGFGIPPGTYHDLGLYEALFVMPALFIGCLIIERIRSRRDGMLTAFVGIVYSIARFPLEYLRIDENHDPRYFGFTPAQYFSIILLTGSVIFLVKILRDKNATRANEGDGGYLPRARRAMQKSGTQEKQAGGSEAPAGRSPGKPKSKGKSAKKRK